MAIRLTPPPGLSFSPPGSGYVFGDGFQWRADGSGRWWLPDSHAHQLNKLLAQGWVIFEEPTPKRIYRSEFERLAIEEPIGVHELIRRCDLALVKLRVYGSKLQVRALDGFINGELRARLEVGRIELRNFLEQQQQVPWEDI